MFAARAVSARSASLTLVSSAVGVVGGCGYSCYYDANNKKYRLPSSLSSSWWTPDYTSLEGSSSSSLTRHHTITPQNISDIIVPTLEATGRVMRLAKTAVLIAMDYKTADWFVFAGSSSNNQLLPQQDEETRFWEDQVTKRQQVLDDTQITYSKMTHLQLNDFERMQAKAHERQAMQQAALELAQAQEQLIALQGDSSKTSQIHRKAARRLLQLCHDNKGVYIKIGQHLANLDYIIPHEYIEILSALFDDNPRTDFEQVRLVIQQDLGIMDPSELFDNFDPEPIASASLAQVHVAYDKTTGKKLAVKVQHYGLRETCAGDLFALVKVVRTAERLFDGFTWGWLADEIAPQLPKELDFHNEGKNAERAAANLERIGGFACVIPKILWNKSSTRVLTMEFEEGFKATDLKAIRRAGLKERDVARLISSVFSSQVFLSGWVHCDPHPANVLLRAKNGKPEMVLVDHGLYRELDPEFRRRYSHLWQSLMLADLKGIKEACHSLGIDKAYTLFASMLTARPYDEMIERSMKGTLHHGSQTSSRADQAVIRNYAQRYLTDIFDLLSSLPRQMLLILKMNDCLRHIDFSLGSPTNTIVVNGTIAARAIYEDRIHTRDMSWLSKWTAWLDYVRVILRVQLYDATVWWMQSTSKLKLTAA